MKEIIVIIFANFLAPSLRSQEILPAKLMAAFTSSRKEHVNIDIRNTTTDKLFYMVGVERLTDTGWSVLAGNINSIGEKEILFLKPLLPGVSARETLSIKKIRYHFPKYNITQLRFFAVCYKKQDWDSAFMEVETMPLKLR